MEFLPRTIEPKYNNENEVWRHLQEAFQEEDGFLFHGYRIFQRIGRDYAYAPDILMLTRKYGLLVIECKGCEIQNIHRIINTIWQMEDFYRDEITPVTQVQDHKHALRGQVRSHLGHEGRIKYRTTVALPFITRQEWEEKQFHLETAGHFVALQEDLTPQGLVHWLENLQKHDPQPPLTDQEWQEVCRALRLPQAPLAAEPSQEPSPEPFDKNPLEDGLPNAKVTLLEYEGMPIHPQVLHRYFPFLEKPSSLDDLGPSSTSHTDYWYLVPTAGLEHFRTNFATEIQHRERLSRGQKKPGPQLLFRKAIQHFIEVFLKERIASRFTEVVALRRAMEVLERDPARRAQLRLDRYAWMEAFHKLEEMEVDLTGDPVEIRNKVVHPEVAQLMVGLYAEFQKEMMATPEVIFEQQARKYFHSTDFRPPRVVVMEGFTRFTPLQLLFIKKCLAHEGCKLVFIYPHHAQQSVGFEAIRDTYQKILELQPNIQVERIRSVKNPSQLMTLQRGLFDPTSVPNASVDSTVALSGFLTRQHEVRTCVAAIQNHLREHPRHRVAVVTRDPQKYKALIREEAQLVGGSEFAQRFDIPPVHLLLTPVGRFILDLYTVWEGSASQVKLNADTFARMLASGWLGRRARESVVLFQSLISTYFARCQDLKSWDEVLGILEGQQRGPVLGGWCTVDDLKLWKNRLEAVNTLTQRLFDGGKYNLLRHIKRLEAALSNMDIDDVQEEERQVLRHIIKVLQDFVSETPLEVTPEEVNEVLNAIVQDRKDEENHQRITVTGPESLDGITKDAVFYLGVDEHRVPGPSGDAWPLAVDDKKLMTHLLQERYLFLAVVRSAKNFLWLSYAQVDDREVCRPSLYLEDVAHLLGLDKVPQMYPEKPDPVPFHHTALPILEVERSQYGVEELAHFQVCPRRYHLQRITTTAHYYRDPWQADFLVEGAVYSKLVRLLIHEHPGGITPEMLDQEFRLKLITRATVEGQQLFPGVKAARWYFIGQSVVGKIIDSIQNMHTDVGPGPVTFDKVTSRPVTVRLGARAIHVQGNLRYQQQFRGTRWVINGDHVQFQWLIPCKKEDSRREAFMWWSEVSRKISKQQSVTDVTRDIIGKVEKSTAEAHPGEHCRFCPVRGLCLEHHLAGIL